MTTTIHYIILDPVIYMKASKAKWVNSILNIIWVLIKIEFDEQIIIRKIDWFESTKMYKNSTIKK